MPARFVYWMNVSVDLRIERDPNEQGGGDWMSITESLHREFNARAEKLTMGVEGRVIHETMESFWPPARHDQTQPDFLREYGEIWTTMPKVMVSRTRTSADHNTRIIGAEDDAVEQLARIRAESSGDIGVGGATIATMLLRAHLLDEVLLYIHPVILGRGRPLFDEPIDPVHLDLLEAQTYEQGVVMHRYGIGAASTSAGR